MAHQWTKRGRTFHVSGGNFYDGSLPFTISRIGAVPLRGMPDATRRPLRGMFNQAIALQFNDNHAVDAMAGGSGFQTGG